MGNCINKKTIPFARAEFTILKNGEPLTLDELVESKKEENDKYQFMMITDYSRCITAFDGLIKINKYYYNNLLKLNMHNKLEMLGYYRTVLVIAKRLYPNAKEA
jgi:hypothetical protein